MSQLLTVDVKGILPLKRQMQILAMPKNLRRRLLNKVAKKVIKDSRKRTRDQVDLQGRPYAKHSKGRRRKMLTRLARQLSVTQLSGQKAEIGFSNPVVGKIASKQQHGDIEQMDASSFNKTETGDSHYNKPATRKQAKALREVDYKIKKANGKGWKKPSLKWVTQNLTVGRAGLILKLMRIKAGETIKKSWVTQLPARSFLGATASEVTQHVETIFKQITNEVQHGIR